MNYGRAAVNFTSLCRYLRYLFTVLFFGLAAVVVNGSCCVFTLLGLNQKFPGFIRKVFIGYMRFFPKTLRACRVGDTRFVNLREQVPPGPCMIVANHTGLLDALLLLGELPDIVFVFKSSLRKNPFFSHMIRQDGFIPNDRGLTSLYAMRKALNNGARVLVFPEGTRTLTPPVNAFSNGFAWVAQKTRVPVVALRIRNPSGILSKGGGLFGYYTLPFLYEYSYAKTFHYEDDEQPAEFSARIRSYYCEQLSVSDYPTWLKPSSEHTK